MGGNKVSQEWDDELREEGDKKKPDVWRREKTMNWNKGKKVLGPWTVLGFDDEEGFHGAFHLQLGNSLGLKQRMVKRAWALKSDTLALWPVGCPLRRSLTQHRVVSGSKSRSPLPEVCLSHWNNLVPYQSCHLKYCTSVSLSVEWKYHPIFHDSHEG